MVLWCTLWAKPKLRSDAKQLPFFFFSNPLRHSQSTFAHYVTSFMNSKFTDVIYHKLQICLIYHKL